jgi:hypothetical protein
MCYRFCNGLKNASSGEKSILNSSAANNSIYNVKEMDTTTEGAPHLIAVGSTLRKVHSTGYGDVTITNRTFRNSKYTSVICLFQFFFTSN